MYKMPSLIGWTCPKCGNVYSPRTTMCVVCYQTIKTTNTSGRVDGHDPLDTFAPENQTDLRKDDTNV